MALVRVRSPSYTCDQAVAKPLLPSVTMGFNAADSRKASPHVAFGATAHVGDSPSLEWGQQTHVGHTAQANWRDADSLRGSANMVSQTAVNRQIDKTLAWGVGDSLRTSANSVMLQATSLSIATSGHWHVGNPLVVKRGIISNSGVPRQLRKILVWGKGGGIYAGSFDPIVVQAPPPPPPPPPDRALLYILPARYFLMSHTIYIERVSDSLELPFYDSQVSTDVGSFCWSFSGSGHPTLQQLLMPVDGVPVQIRATLDGIPFVFAVDKVGRSSQFGSNRINVSARSVTSSLSAPYALSSARTNDQAMTAFQIGTFALQDSGIDLDFGIGAGNDANSGLVDWLVPAGAFSVIGTPLQAVQAVVEAAGGYVQSHRSLPTLLARHPYGVRIGDAGGAPWQWMDGSADVELAPDALITESIERNDGADINGVYVSGTTQGVLGLVKITGSAGDKLGQIVTDPLITHVDAARQRGLSILGSAGKQQRVTLELPVLVGTNQPGILDVGQLVQVNSATPWRGRVRAVSVSARLPTLRQSITLERHI